MNKEITLAQYQKANREIRQKDAKKGFMANLAAYIIVNSVLITINALLVRNSHGLSFRCSAGDLESQ
jgi:hypothetical protein